MTKLKEITTHINDLFAKVTECLPFMKGGQELQSTQGPLEWASKSLEFEADTFKIDSSGRKQETRKVNGKDMLMKVHPAWDVLEYVDWPTKWEQLFIGYDNFINYVAQAKWCSVQQAEQKYLLTKKELKAKMSQIDYKVFYKKEIKWHLAGFWFVIFKRCFFVGTRSDMWLSGGDYAWFNKHLWYYFCSYASFGLSGRLLKN